MVKAHRSNAMIHKLFNFSSSIVKFRMFTTFVHPIIEYASVIWALTKKGKIDIIEKIQKSFTKKLFPLDHQTYEKCLNMLQGMSLVNCWRFLDLLLVFQIMHHSNKLLSLENLSIGVSSSSRHNMNLIPKLAINAIIDKEFLWRICCLWNYLPDDIKNYEHLNTFREKLLSWFDASQGNAMLCNFS